MEITRIILAILGVIAVGLLAYELHAIRQDGKRAVRNSLPYRYPDGEYDGFQRGKELFVPTFKLSTIADEVSKGEKYVPVVVTMQGGDVLSTHLA